MAYVKRTGKKEGSAFYNSVTARIFHFDDSKEPDKKRRIAILLRIYGYDPRLFFVNDVGAAIYANARSALFFYVCLAYGTRVISFRILSTSSSLSSYSSDHFPESALQLPIFLQGQLCHSVSLPVRTSNMRSQCCCCTEGVLHDLLQMFHITSCP